MDNLSFILIAIVGLLYSSCTYESKHIIQGFSVGVKQLFENLRDEELKFVSSNDTLVFKVTDVKMDTLRLVDSFNYWFKEYPSSDWIKIGWIIQRDVCFQGDVEREGISLG